MSYLYDNMRSKGVSGYIKEARDYAKEFLLTAAAQRNRNYLEDKILFNLQLFYAL